MDDGSSLTIEESAAESSELTDRFIEGIHRDTPPVQQPHLRVLYDYYSTVDPALVEYGWSITRAKSADQPFYKFDQNLITHVRTGVFCILKFISEVSDEGLPPHEDRETLLRELVGMFVIHDIHKEFEQGYYDEFEISESTVESFVEEFNLQEFAPTLDLEDYHAVAVAHHMTLNSKSEMVTDTFYDLKWHIRLADGLSSTSSAEDIAGERFTETVELATQGSETARAHSINRPETPVTSVINKSVSNFVTEHTWNTMSIHSDGCGYVTEVGSDSLSDNIDDVDGLYESFLEALRESFPEYRNRSLLADTERVSPSSGKYKLSDLDILCLPKQELIRSIVEKGVNQGDSPFDLPEYTEEALSTIEDAIDINLPRTYRIEGLSRIVHTFRDDIATKLVDTDGKPFELNEAIATIYAFNCSSTCLKQIEQIQDKIDSGEVKQKSWLCKYLIAADILNRDTIFSGESGGESIDILSNQLLQRLDQFSKWGGFREQTIGPIESELKRELVESMTIHGVDEPVFDEEIVEEPTTSETHECGVCGGQTTASDLRRPELFKEEFEDEEDNSIKVEIEGKTVDVKYLCQRERLCYMCQLDLSLLATDSGWTDSDDDYLHYSLTSEYPYVPVSGVIFDEMTDEFLRKGTSPVGMTRQLLSDSTRLDVYEDIISVVTENSFGRSIISDTESGLLLRHGYGGYSTRVPIKSGDKIESTFNGVFSLLVASAYSGLSLYVSSEPVLRQDSGQKNRELVTLSDNLQNLRPVISSNQITLSSLPRLLETVSAVFELGEACGHEHAPLDAYTSYVEETDSLLVGTQMVADSDEKLHPEMIRHAVRLNENIGRNNKQAEEILVLSRNIATEFWDLYSDSASPLEITAYFIEISDIVSGSNRGESTENIRTKIQQKLRSYLPKNELTVEEDHHVREVATYITTILNENCGGSPDQFGVLSDEIEKGVWIQSKAKANNIDIEINRDSKR